MNQTNLKTLGGNTVGLVLGDCMEVVQNMQDESIGAIITSPPYFRKIDYGNGENQLGLEKTPDEYIARLGLIFEQCFRVMENGATLWIIINDTYNNSAPLRKNLSERKNKSTVPFHTRRNLMDGYREKELLGIPFLLKDELRRRRFIWRSLNIWRKPTFSYDSGTDRPTINHEYVLQFVKALGNGRPYANVSRIDESVWDIAPESYGGHPCPFPVALASKIIRALPKGTTVLDPMAGVFSTAISALQNGLDSISIEIKPTYFEIGQQRIDDEIAKIARSRGMPSSQRLSDSVVQAGAFD